MTFVARMIVREMRASWRRLLFFFLCIAVGVGAIVALRSVIQSVRQTFAGEARALITADAIITSNQALKPELAATIDRRLSEAGATSLQSIEMATMVRAADRQGGAPGWWSSGPWRRGSPTTDGWCWREGRRSRRICWPTAVR